MTRDKAENEANDNVVTLPNARGRRSTDDENDPIEESIKKIAGKDKALKKGLTAIHSRDTSFDPDQFVDGAKVAYEMIVTGFADGDKRMLKGLLAREVYDNFEAAIDDRASRNERVQSSFVGIEKSEIVGAELLKDELSTCGHSPAPLNPAIPTGNWLQPTPDRKPVCQQR